MGHAREIPRTATFAWSPDTVHNYIATGTLAGAVNPDFSDETKLEIWNLQLSQNAELSPVASLSTDSRFYDLAWSHKSEEKPEGIIAGALENGALELWDASALRSDSSNASIARHTSHTGSIKSLQFNPTRRELLATSGLKGELYVTDLNNSASAFRLGSTTARTDDFDSLDWNKKIPHILVTGSSGGFVTVWDVRAKKENLTLNNLGRKEVSAVAWNPDMSTKLATAIPRDQDPLILLWDLRNASTPERILKGHDQGVLSLSWCSQDSELLLSCGKDNRNICWNASSGEMLGEFPIVTNWTFETRWSPSQPSLLATASFDGKIAVQSIQNISSQGDTSLENTSQVADGEDFFARAQCQPQGVSFSLKQSPKWLRKPVGASFGFGGKVVTFGPQSSDSRKSILKISTYLPESGVEAAISEFQMNIKSEDLSGVCAKRITGAKTTSAKADWEVIQMLTSAAPRKAILEYLKIRPTEITNPSSQLNNEEASKAADQNGSADPDASFFDKQENNSSLLADLALSKGTISEKPFKILATSENPVDKQIASALMLGSFERACDICIQEDRMSDAFMIAICGGQSCVDKVQNVYFTKQSQGPPYLRLLASIVGKNLWDVVHNADLRDWAEIMATLCTFADETEFSALCEALGDRLKEREGSEETSPERLRNASFCYLVGSKLDKTVPMWLSDMHKAEAVEVDTAGSDSSYSIHVKSLQDFIEKVAVYCKVTDFQDTHEPASSARWKLSPLYSTYIEYAEIAAAHGHLELAKQYLDLLPPDFDSVGIAKDRVKNATAKSQRSIPSQVSQRRTPNKIGASNPTGPVVSVGFQPLATGPYAPATNAGYPQQRPSYAPPTQQGSQSFVPDQKALPQFLGGPQALPLGPVQPPYGSPTGPPVPKSTGTANWNDTPDFGLKPPTSRRSTPAPVASPLGSHGGVAAPNSLNSSGPQYGPPKSQSPLPPPPKGPAQSQSPQQSVEQVPPRAPSAAASQYAPPLASQPQATIPLGSSVQRSSSPYNMPPSAPPPSNRYAPSVISQQAPAPAGSPGPPTMSNAYRAPLPASNSFAPARGFSPSQPPISSIAAQPPPLGPPKGPPQSASFASPKPAIDPATTAQPQAGLAYPSGDRSHIPPQSQPIYNIFDSEMQRIKSKAPSSYKREVDDTEKRLNILFDHLNNGDLLKTDTIVELKTMAESIQARDFEKGQAILTSLLKTKMDEGGNWLVGVKRLISMSRATPI